MVLEVSRYLIDFTEEPFDSTFCINAFGEVVDFMTDNSFESIFVHIGVLRHCNKSYTSVMTAVGGIDAKRWQAFDEKI